MQKCPICHSDTKPNPRYPNYVCRDCLAAGVIVAGKVVPIDQIDIRSNYKVNCSVSGVQCVAREAHFGGCVVEPATD